jgi:hypothetical protein
MNLPGFTAESSVYFATGRYSMSATSEMNGVILQIRCPCPPGLLGKAIRVCNNPSHGGAMCDIADQCMDCFG